MANFDNLRESITEVIRQNGNEEITGEVLQFVLLEMVSGLGAGFRFMGVATPETVPEEEDGAAFYIGGSGEYENFTGIAIDVPEGSICFFKWNNGAWSYSVMEISRPVDDDITENGQNPVKGGVIYEEFQKLRGAGYAFAGVATLQTNPGEVTEKVFYLAAEAGVYVNFGGGMTLPSGISILKYNGSEWTSDTLWTVGGIVSGGNALVTSGTIFEAMEQKVSKETGKGLSEEDYTSTEKTKLEGLPTAEQLAALLLLKQDVLMFDDAPTENSNNPVKSGGIHNAIKDFITKAVTDLVNYYTKNEVFTKTEVTQMIAAVRQFRYELVDELPEASAETVGIIYFVPSDDPQQRNVKNEFITLTRTEGGETVYFWEQIGSTEIDLSGYATIEAMNQAIATALEDYYTKTEIDGLIAAAKGLLADINMSSSVEVVQAGVQSSVTIQVVSSIAAESIVLKKDGSQVATGLGLMLSYIDVINEASAGSIAYQAVLTIGGVERTVEMELDVEYPIYYGAKLTAAEVTQKATARKTPAGWYSFAAAQNESYLFVLVPSGMTVHGMTMSGIEVPLESPTGIEVGGVSYTAYQSSNTYDAGTYVINIY